MSKEYEFNAVLYELRRNYPQGVSTFGRCSVAGCDNAARGSGKCAKCCEREMAKLVGVSAAMRVHAATKEAADAVGCAISNISEG